MAYLIGYLINGVIFGLITRYIAQSKGYEGGFWWGFFLGLIGVLVVGFRPDISRRNSYSTYNSQGNSYSHSYGNQGAVSQQRLPPKEEEKRWICIKCKAENPEKSKFCCECGEPRHYDWKCGKCGETNKAHVKFCFNCGKEKDASEEIMPDTKAPDTKKTELSDTYKAVFPLVDACASVEEMIPVLKGADMIDLEDESIKQMFKDLEEIQKMEYFYGKLKSNGIEKIKQYLG